MRKLIIILTIFLGISCSNENTNYKKLKEKADSLRTFAKDHHHNANYDEAYEHHKQAQIIYQLIKHEHGEIKSLISITYIHLDRGEYEKASETCLEALEKAQKIKNDTLIAISCIMIGGIYDEQRNSTLAEQYYEKGLIYATSVKDDYAIGSCLNSLGIIFMNRKEYRKALINFQKVIPIFYEDSVIIGDLYNNIGETYQKMSFNDSALIYFQKTLPLKKIFDKEKGLGITYWHLAHLELLKNNLPEAEIHLKKAEQILFAAQLKNYYQDVLYDFAKLYEKSGNYKKAYFYKNKYEIIHDTLINTQSIMSQGEMKKKYEMRELERKKADEANLKQQIKAKIQSFLFAGIVSILLVVFFMFSKHISSSFRDLIKFAVLLVVVEMIDLFAEPYLIEPTVQIFINYLRNHLWNHDGVDAIIEICMKVIVAMILLGIEKLFKLLWKKNS